MCRFQTWYRHCKIQHFECNALEYMSPPDNAPHLNAFMVWCLCINYLLDKLLQTDVHFFTLLTYTFHIASQQRRQYEWESRPQLMGQLIFVLRTGINVSQHLMIFLTIFFKKYIPQKTHCWSLILMLYASSNLKHFKTYLFKQIFRHHCFGEL